jgi:hypothetical protein
MHDSSAVAESVKSLQALVTPSFSHMPLALVKQRCNIMEQYSVSLSSGLIIQERTLSELEQTSL